MLALAFSQAAPQGRIAPLASPGPRVAAAAPAAGPTGSAAAKPARAEELSATVLGISAAGAAAAAALCGKAAARRRGRGRRQRQDRCGAAAAPSLRAAAPSKAEKSSKGRKAKKAADEPPPPPPRPTFDPSKEEIGVLPPLDYFDPFGFSKVGDRWSFRGYRYAEMKHGRVAMLAALGAVVQHYVKFPGFQSVPSGLAAVITPPGTYGFLVLLVFAGGFEIGPGVDSPNREVGDFGDPLGIGMYDKDMRNREINNGRFAMFAALGIISAELLTGKDAVEQLGL